MGTLDWALSDRSRYPRDLDRAGDRRHRRGPARNIHAATTRRVGRLAECRSARRLEIRDTGTLHLMVTTTRHGMCTLPNFTRSHPAEAPILLIMASSTGGRLIAAIVAGVLSLLPAVPVAAQTDQKVTICQATGSATNPWVFTTIDARDLPEHLARGDY